MILLCRCTAPSPWSTYMPLLCYWWTSLHDMYAWHCLTSFMLYMLANAMLLVGLSSWYICLSMLYYCLASLHDMYIYMSYRFYLRLPPFSWHIFMEGTLSPFNFVPWEILDMVFYMTNDYILTKMTHRRLRPRKLANRHQREFPSWFRGYVSMLESFPVNKFYNYFRNDLLYD